jgi:hypothetical protein
VLWHVLAADAGLGGGRVIERFDCFAGTPAGSKVSADLLVHSVNFYAAKMENEHAQE